MRLQDIHDRPPEVDLTPRWVIAFLVAMGLMITAYAFIHYVAVQQADAGHGQPTVRLVEHHR